MLNTLPTEAMQTNVKIEKVCAVRAMYLGDVLIFILGDERGIRRRNGAESILDKSSDDDGGA